METNKSPVRLVFQLVFFVALKGIYFNMFPLARLEYELKSYAVFLVAAKADACRPAGMPTE